MKLTPEQIESLETFIDMTNEMGNGPGVSHRYKISRSDLSSARTVLSKLGIPIYRPKAGGGVKRKNANFQPLPVNSVSVFSTAEDEAKFEAWKKEVGIS